MRADLIKETVKTVMDDTLVEWQFYDEESISIDGEKLFLRPWRFDRRFIACSGRQPFCRYTTFPL